MNHRFVVLGIIAFCSQAFAQGDYKLKAQESATGTRIRSNAAQDSKIPLSKKYEEFTPEDVAALKSQYESMPEGDEPPFPREGLKQLVFQVRDAATKRQASGRLSLVASVDAMGKVEKVDILASPDDQLSRYAAIMLGRTAFKPAMCSGQPCRMDFPFFTMIRLE